MKKSILFLAFFTTVLLSNAQQFGLKTGVNITNLKGDDAEGYEALARFYGGAFVQLNLNRELSFQPEVLYSAQGGKYEAGATTYRLRLNYLNIPLLIKYTSSSGFFGATGPQVGFLIGSKVKTGDITVDAEDTFESTDVSWAFGLGYMFNGQVGLEGRYNLGLTKIVEDNSSEVQNSVFQVGIIYKLSLK
jgi:Outer membrane protein beta-barrel domain